MKVIRTIKEMQLFSQGMKLQNKKIGCVPTMGFLHRGHESLITRAKDLSDCVVVSIFVNPTQFGPNEDFDRYPRAFENDCKLIESAGADAVFAPDVLEMYPVGFLTEVKIGKVTEKFEGERRPGHFEGVALVVAKLFNAIKPDIAVFGQKDYQQTLVIKKMIRDLNFGIDIVIAPTMRESDGLAMSSRNTYLSPAIREKATILFQALEEAIKAIESGTKERKIINAIMHKTLRSELEIKIDYAVSALSNNLEEPDVFLAGDHIVLLLACFLGKTRLIDNAVVTVPLTKQM